MVGVTIVTDPQAARQAQNIGCPQLVTKNVMNQAEVEIVLANHVAR